MGGASLKERRVSNIRLLEKNAYLVKIQVIFIGEFCQGTVTCHAALPYYFGIKVIFIRHIQYRHIHKVYPMFHTTIKPSAVGITQCTENATAEHPLECKRGAKKKERPGFNFLSDSEELNSDKMNRIAGCVKFYPNVGS